jgi:hypothetical protein
VLAGAFGGARAAAQPADVRHASSELVKLAEDFRQFRSPIFRARTWKPRRSVPGVPDYAAVVKEQREGLPRFQARLSALDPGGWPVHDQVDYLLLRSEMDDVDFEHRVLRETTINPSFYIQQAIGGVQREMGAVVPYSVEKAEAILSAFERHEPILAQGYKSIVIPEAAADLCKTGLRHIKDIGKNYPAGAKLLEPHFPQSHRARLLPAAEKAAVALEKYGQWVEANLPKMRGRPHVGRENLEWLLKRVYWVPWSIEEMLYMAEMEKHRFLMSIEIEETKNQGLKELTMPTTDEWIEWFRLTYLQTKYWMKDVDFISFPPFVGESYLEKGVWQEPFGEFGNRTGMIGFPTEPKKEPGKRLFVVDENHWFTQTYFERWMRIDPQADYQHSDWPGHYFEAEVTNRNPCPIRARHRDPAFSNWAHYLEEIFLDLGYPFLRGPRSREIAYNLLLLRAVRVPLDFLMSTGEHSFEEAIKYQIVRVPTMEEHVSRAEVEGYIRNPFSAASYLIGKKQIEQVLAERIGQLGFKVSWREFHDAMLSYGSIPITFIRWEMTGHDDQVRALWTKSWPKND